MSKLHDALYIPEGQTVGEVLPAFSGVTNELHLGEPNRECASCRKLFSAVRKPRKAIRLYPAWTPIPIAFSFRICGACADLWRQGGDSRDGVSASLIAYCTGNGATQ
jgi:hypothetical protein